MTDNAPGRRNGTRARAIFAISAALLTAALVAAACGGSASESPWPVEPDNLVTGPEGEEGKRPPRKEHRTDAGVDPDAGPNVEP